MITSDKEILEELHNLPFDKKQEVYDFIIFLKQKGLPKYTPGIEKAMIDGYNELAEEHQHLSKVMLLELYPSKK